MRMEIGNLKEGESVRGKFAIRDKEPPKEYKTKPGRYFFMYVGNKTGDIYMKYWGGADERKTLSLYNGLNIGDVIEITGDVLYDRFDKQLVIAINEDTHMLRKCNEDEYSIEDFIPKTKKNVEEMLTELNNIIQSIHNEHLNKLLHKFFDDTIFISCFKEVPAATSKHHNYLGGNLEHVLSVTKFCMLICDIYPELNRDLLLTSAILHDVGKLSEYIYTTSIERTDTGKMVGHLILGDRIINQKIEEIEDFPEDLKMKLSHTILSHHGRVEWGSPIGLKTAEACALHYADEFDAKVKEFLQSIEKASQYAVDWAYSPSLGHEIYLH